MSFNYAGIQFATASAFHNAGRVRGFDNDHVVIGDGNVGVEDFMVQGSRSFTRDPRLASMAQAAVGVFRVPSTGVYLHGFAPISLPMRVDHEKWCYICDETKSKDRFSPRKDTYDKLNPHCMDCENARNRARYEAKIGHPPRPYARRSAVVFLTGYVTGNYTYDNFTTSPLDASA